MDEQKNIGNEVDDLVLGLLATYEPELEENIKFDDDPSEQLYKLKLKLGPLGSTQNHSSDIFASVIIFIYKGYPAREADISFDKYGGITEDQQHKLQESVKKTSLEHASLDGAIFAVCSCIQDVLTNFSDEKVANEEAKRIEKEDLDKKQFEIMAEKERNFLEKRRKVEIAIKKEGKQKREEVRERTISLSDVSQVEMICTKSPYKHIKLEEKSTPIAFMCTAGNEICDPTLPLTVEIGSSKILLNSLIKEKPQEHVHIFFGYNTETKDNLIIYKWAIHINPKMIDDDEVLKLTNALKILEPEVNLMLKLNHKNIVSFKGLKWIRNGDGCINVFLLYDLLSGLSASYYMKNKISVEGPSLRHITEGTLNALEYLHSKNVVHGNIRPSSIHLDQISQNVKLSNYGLKKKCSEAVAEYYNTDVAEIYPILPSRCKKADDIYRLGLVVTQLYNARVGPQVFINQRSKITAKFSSFVNCCLDTPSNGERWSADELLAHKFITDDDDSSIAYGIDGNGMPWIPENLKSESRLYKNYTCLYKLGKGGFGTVYKVQSNVDGNLYALKIVKLKEEHYVQSRKMIQEVKLLSSLNHENVVRYYTSWKETLSEMLLVNPIEENVSGTDRAQSSHMVTIEDSSSEMISDSDNTESDEEESHSRSIGSSNKEDDSYIEFAEPTEQGTSTGQEQGKIRKRKTKKTEMRFVYLYIQMEYCKKNTLRQAIDNKRLFRDESRMWRLFREVVNGLNYIHSKGLIHRDLKPGNIFLDFNDHVKIGDFGLATASVDRSSQLDSLSSRNSKSSAYLTGRVGTTFYIAPEIKTTTGLKVNYCNKVDMYSLGIIFFEMIYPFNSAMERVKVLTDLISDAHVYPNDYSIRMTETRNKLVEMLLNVDPCQRPSARNLMNSYLLPPLPAEQQKFINMIKEAIEKEGSARYQEMLQIIFNENSNFGIEATFEAFKSHKLKNEELEDVHNIYCNVIDIFRKHGGIWIPTPFFMPKGAGPYDSAKSADFLTKDGHLITSQFDLRYPFARFIAKNDFKKLKRFYIDKIHRSIKTPGVHPIETYECAFDIVDNDINLVESVVRLLLVAQEVLLDVCGFDSDEVVIKLSHTHLVRIMLFQANIEGKYHQAIFNLLSELQYKVCGFDEDSFLNCIGKITNESFNSEALKSVLSMNGTISEVITAITAKGVSLKNKNNFQKICSQLEDLFTFSTDMGLKIAFKLQPLMVADKVLYDGMAFELQTVNSSHKHPYVVLAKGGSYFHLVSSHRGITYKSVSKENLCTVGISIALSSLYTVCKKIKGKQILKKSNTIQVLVCSIGERQIKRRMVFVNDLEDLGLTVDHCFLEDETETSQFSLNGRYVENILCLLPEEENKYIVKSVELEDSQTKVSVKYLSIEDTFQYFTKIARPYSSDTSNPSISRRESYGKNMKALPHQYQLAVEYIVRKPLRDKEEKIRQKIQEDVDTYLSSKFGSFSIPGPVALLAVDMDKTFLVSLRELDLDATLKSFNDSVTELKCSSRDQDFKDYIDKISKFCVKHLFHNKKQRRPFIIFAYSIPSEHLRRIY